MNIFFYDNSFMFRSQDVQSVFMDDSSVSDISKDKKGHENSFNTLQNEKKVTYFFLTVIHCY